MMNRVPRLTFQAIHSPRLHDVAAALTILGVWLLFYWRLFTPVEVDRVQFPTGDFTQQFFVFRSFAFDELRQGRLPLWMPCIDSGYPYQADPQSALFYPSGLLNLLLHIAAGVDQFPLGALQLESTLHVLLAALLMYVFLRGEVQHRAAALIGALVFGFGGYLTGYPVLQTAIVEAAAWLPLALWGARRLAARGDGRSIAFTAAPLALSILAGHPQTYTYILYLVSLYFIYRARRAHMSWRGIAVRCVVVAGLTILLSAVQLLPSFEYARQSTRTDLPYIESGTGFPLADVIQFIVAGVVSHFSPLYIGLLPLALVGIAIGAARQRDKVFWLLLGVAGLLLSFGGHLAVFDPAYGLMPGYRLFRDQERHALIVALAMSVLAAYGADATLRSLSRRSRAWLRGEMRWLGIILVLLIAALAVTVYLSWQSDPAARGVPDRIALSVMALSATLGALALRSVRPARRWLPIAMVVIVGFDLATANRAVNWAAPFDPFPAQPAIQAIRNDADASLFRIHDERRLPGHSLCMAGLDEIGGITPIHLANYDRVLKAVPREIRWSMLNVRYIVTWRGALEDVQGRPVDATLLWQGGEGQDVIYVYRLNWHPPRAWLVHEIETRADREAIFAALAEPDFNPYRVAYTQLSVPAVTNAAFEPVTVLDVKPSALTLSVNAVTPGLLVVSEVNYPGWIATVNGIEAPIIEVDGVLRGVALPAGSARIEFVYRPMSLIVGGMLSAIGLALWLVLTLSRRQGD